MKHFVRVTNYVVLKLVNLVRIAKVSTIKTEKNLKSPKLLPVFNINSKVAKINSMKTLFFRNFYLSSVHLSVKN